MIDRGNHGVGQAADGKVGALDVALRGMFLACSWTWCIGMFFPVFFVGDFGLWGWVAFAVPNVLGAGAMGWVLRRRGASEEMVAKHAAAMRWFSIVTIMFQVSFAMWFFQLHLPRINHRYVMGVWLLLFLIQVNFGFERIARRMWDRLAIIAYFVSLAAAAGTSLATDSLELPGANARHGFQDLAMAAPVLLFGFALCPYLDLTFHRVRRETPGNAGTMAFWIGFIGFFLPMIVFTLFYAGGILSGKQLSTFVAVHVAIQLAFTIAAHFRELSSGSSSSGIKSETGSSRSRDLIGRFLWPVVGIAVAVASSYLPMVPDIRPGYPAHRLVYELFMSFYALIFPAYVWIVVIERGLPRATRLTLYVIALTLASPCLWLGYIEQHYVWLLPGVAIPLLFPVIASPLLARPTAR